MKAKVFVLAVAAALAVGAAFAASAAEALKARGCLGCHDMEKKKVGPTFKDVAAKYKGNQGAVAELVEKLKAGKGHMKAKGSDAELEAAVKEALGQ
ncbi:MAG: c-type cytochrome [Betaproteobacteria bacterium]|nr:c-type cytochrome [Betaproteobacteria bacterium]